MPLTCRSLRFAEATEGQIGLEANSRPRRPSRPGQRPYLDTTCRYIDTCRTRGRPKDVDAEKAANRKGSSPKFVPNPLITRYCHRTTSPDATAKSPAKFESANRPPP
jgi:hypothetical protein